MSTFDHIDTMSRIDTIDRVDETDLAVAERRLAEAGLSFTVVERCGQPDCEVCEPPDVATAA